jgi:hypothetical protein
VLNVFESQNLKEFFQLLLIPQVDNTPYECFILFNRNGNFSCCLVLYAYYCTADVCDIAFKKQYYARLSRYSFTQERAVSAAWRLFSSRLPVKMCLRLKVPPLCDSPM